MLGTNVYCYDYSRALVSNINMSVWSSDIIIVIFWILAKVCNPALEHFVEIQVLSLERAIIMWTSEEFCEVFFHKWIFYTFFPQKFRWGGGGVEGVENKRRCGAKKFSRLQELWKPSSVTVKNCNSFEESSWTFNWFIQNDNFLGV